MRPGRLIALVLGCLLVLPAGAAIVGGAVLGGAYAFARDDDGYFADDLDRLATDTAAITATDLDIVADPDEGVDWLLDRLDLDVRVRLTTERELGGFVGIATQADVAAWLGDVAHDEVVRLDADNDARYERRGTEPGPLPPPAEQDFWEASASGPGTQELVWEPRTGNWAVVIADVTGTPGVVADVEVGVRSGAVLPLAVATVVGGLVVALIGAALIIVGIPRAADEHEDIGGTAPSAEPTAPAPTEPHPVALEATLDPALSRWMWLVKWILALPHLVVLAALWIAFTLTTFIAGVAILFTGRYPRGIFDFNVGVLRWTWRVAHYAGPGSLGTDRYPPFSLEARPDDVATLEIAYPESLSRGLVLVKWWLLAIPHYVLLAVLVGGGIAATDTDTSISALGAIVLIAGLALLFTGRYPRGLFDLVVGLNRWGMRVLAYVALMTDVYPPFRLDQGGQEPDAGGPPPPPSGPPLADIDLATEPTPTPVG